MIVRILRADEATEAMAEQLSRLAAQLRGAPIIVTVEWLAELLRFPRTWLVVAEVEEGNVIGMLTLSSFPRMTGWTPWIEGVVVEETMRGKGIGRALLEKAVEIARTEGFTLVNLSSRPHREAANALYETLGFAVVPTNYRRLTL